MDNLAWLALTLIVVNSGFAVHEELHPKFLRVLLLVTHHLTVQKRRWAKYISGKLITI